MKIYLSYFYQVRFMKPYMIPVSTCLFDPHWFTDEAGKIYKDKNGVYNGIRCDEFLPPPLDENDAICPCKDKNSQDCRFLKGYADALLNVDFNAFMGWMRRLAAYVQEKEKFVEEPIIILLVYEALNNPCSERGPLIDWFAKNNYELKNWNKTMV